MNNRYICIHGHFYQPPRENPWLETVEAQDSARPYHDWNERITAEAYAPNGAARIMGPGGLITRIVNNYEFMSFNFGPTLAAWVEKNNPEAYRFVQQADARSVQARGGHGNAMAQVYNHMIMPLASARDKETQVVWGKRDFQYRFNRVPEGMWLAEAAADAPSLRALAREGIKFTVLAPNQAARIRRLAPDGQARPDEPWMDLPPDSIDPKRPYRLILGDGLSLDVFFYDGPISRAIAFENLLTDGTRYAGRLLGAFVPDRDEPQLVSVATDGESYGHHAAHGEMGLAFAIHVLTQPESPATLTNFGQYLALFPPQWEVQVHEPSSWSCVHGVGRWTDNCGCTSRDDWHQLWRAPLRAALDHLRSRIDPLFEEQAGRWLKDPWRARNDYIEVILQRSPERIEHFLRKHHRKPLSTETRVDLMRLFEMQRHGLLMYTSCGWFFDDISRLEGVQILRYAARAVQLARHFGVDVEPEVVRLLEQAPSNVPEFKNGAGVWRREVSPSFVDLRRVVAHYAIRSLVDGHAPKDDLFSYQVTPTAFQHETFGQTGWALGTVEVTSAITRETLTAAYAVLHFGAQDFHCSVGAALEPEGFAEMMAQLSRSYNRHSLTEILRLLDRQFGEDFYTIKDLLADERRRILFGTLRDVLDRYASSYRNLFEQSSRIFQYLAEIGERPPVEFLAAAQYVVKTDLEQALSNPENGVPHEAAVALRRARRWGIPLELDTLELRIRRSIEGLARKLSRKVELGTLEQIDTLLEFADMVPVRLNLWETQNHLHAALRQQADREAMGKPAWDMLLRVAERVHLNTRQMLEEVQAAAEPAASVG